MVRVINMSDIGDSDEVYRYVEQNNHRAVFVPDGTPRVPDKCYPAQRHPRSQRRYSEEEEKELHRQQDEEQRSGN